MRYFKDTTGTVHGYDEQIPAYAPYIEKAIANQWQEVTGSWPPKLTQEQTQSILSTALGSAINDGANQWGYDSIESASTYVNSTNPQYVADAKALIAWRDKVWEWAIPKLANVAPGTTPGEFLADMPELPPQPK